MYIFPSKQTERDREKMAEFTVFNETSDDARVKRVPKYSAIKHLVNLNRTRPQTCDRKIILYQLEPETQWDRKNLHCSNVTR